MNPQQMRAVADEFYRRAHIAECWDRLHNSTFNKDNIPANADDDWVVRWAKEWNSYCANMHASGYTWYR